LAEKWKPSLAEVLSLGPGLSGFSGVLSWPELQLSKYEAGVNVPMAYAAEVLSLVSGLWPLICAGRVLAENWKPSLAEVLSLGSGLFGVNRGFL